MSGDPSRLPRRLSRPSIRGHEPETERNARNLNLKFKIFMLDMQIYIKPGKRVLTAEVPAPIRSSHPSGAANAGGKASPPKIKDVLLK